MDVHRRWLLLGLVAVSGCSLTLSGPGPKMGGSARSVPRCDTGKALVGVDGVAAGALGVAALVLADQNELESAAVFGLVSAGLIAAAVHGNRKVNACRAALDDYDVRMQRTARVHVPSATAPAVPRPPDSQGAPPSSHPAMTLPGTVPASPVSATSPRQPASPPRTPAQAPVTALPADTTWADFWTEVP